MVCVIRLGVGRRLSLESVAEEHPPARASASSDTSETRAAGTHSAARREWGGAYESRREEATALLLQVSVSVLCLGCTSCIVKSFRSRGCFFSSPVWTPYLTVGRHTFNEDSLS